MWISVGHGPVLWGVDYGHDVWFKQLGRPEGCASPPLSPHCTPENIWERVTPQEAPIDTLDVGRDGHVWAVTKTQQIIWREGITELNKKGTAWATSTSVYTQDDQGEAVNTDTPFGKANQVVICTNG